MSRFILFIKTVCSIFLISCGTQDYGPYDKKTDANIAADKTIVSQSKQTTNEEKIENEILPKVGYLWQGLRWIGVPSETVGEFQSRLADEVDSINNFEAFGTAVLGGAVLGVIINVSGSWFFGTPKDSSAGHLFGERMDRVFKEVSQGIVRGGVFAGGCYLALSGIHPLPYDGLLGSNFSALSSSIILGGMGAGSSLNIFNKMPIKDWGQPKSELGKSIYSQKYIGRVMRGFQQWTTTTEIGKGLRFKFIPGVIILGIGSGIGLIVYNFIQDNEIEKSARMDAVILQPDQ